MQGGESGGSVGRALVVCVFCNTRLLNLYNFTTSKFFLILNLIELVFIKR